MQIIQMWRDMKYPKMLPRILASSMRVVGKEHYTLICNDEKLAQYLGVESKNFDEEYERILDLVPDRKWWEAYCTMNMYRADMMRLYYASQMSDLFYLDADIALNWLPDFNRHGKPFFLDGDIKMFFVNERTDWFENLLREIVDTLPPEPYVIYKYVKERLQKNRESFEVAPGASFFPMDFGRKYKA